jgi:hypothetical protein
MSTPVLRPEPSQNLSPVAWLAVTGTFIVALAALFSRSSSLLPEQSVFVLWVVGLALQIVAGVTAIFRRLWEGRRL